jgi:hypothetical protein
LGNSFFSNQAPLFQFISCEDKAMNFYEELLKNEDDSSTKIELVKAYSDLILKRIDWNITGNRQQHEYSLALLNSNLELEKLNKNIQLKQM